MKSRALTVPMPPRIPLSSCLRAASACSKAGNGNSLVLPFRPFSSSCNNQSSPVKGKRKFRDPYAITQARTRKAANISRQEVLGKQRTEEMGSSVRGKTTPFVESFDTGRNPTEDKLYRLDHYIQPEELEAQLERSKTLMTPLPFTPSNSDTPLAEIARIDEENIRKHDRDHSNVQEVMKRLLNLDNGSSKGRYRVNVQRCIETFGRHNTDKILPPKPSAITITAAHDTGSITTATEGAEEAARAEIEPRDQIVRKGPDTGSSEVQIAILTAKIRSLANFLDTRGRKDKVGKRDLRLLVHRRQKLLKYLRKKERGGPRWQRCIETLGLTEGTWKGEISL